jgi:4-carboxymuconolactone decarboxylase
MFEPLTDREWPSELEAMRGGFATQLNVYRAMAHHPALLRAWQDFRNHVVTGSSFSGTDLEIIILRTGYRRHSPYEWAHHVFRGRKTGLDDGRILSCADGPQAFERASDRLLAAAVDELVDDSRLSAPTLAALTARYGKAGVLDLMATVGLYTTLSFLVNSFATPIDADVAEELARRPLSA